MLFGSLFVFACLSFAKVIKSRLWLQTPGLDQRSTKFRKGRELIPNVTVLQEKSEKFILPKIKLQGF